MEPVFVHNHKCVKIQSNESPTLVILWRGVARYGSDSLTPPQQDIREGGGGPGPTLTSFSEKKKKKLVKF